MHRRIVAITLAAAGTLAIGGLALIAPDGAQAAVPRPDDRTVAPAPPTQGCELFDGRTVLELVRVHRRGAPEELHRELAQAIVDESRSAGLDPLLVASIVASESSFRTGAVSRAGAVGLMQLRPFVARDVATRADVTWHEASTLTSASQNLRLGIVYYRELLERFDGNDEIALSAYNRGPTRVGRTLSNGTYRGSEYARRILTRYGRLAGARPADPLAGCAAAA